LKNHALESEGGGAPAAISPLEDEADIHVQKMKPLHIGEEGTAGEGRRGWKEGGPRKEGRREGQGREKRRKEGRGRRKDGRKGAEEGRNIGRKEGR
jgi:hypothetical protein